MRRLGIAAVLLFLLSVAGCLRAHVINVTVTNTSQEILSTIEISYPEATFGINSLGPGKSFQYKIKPISTGALKIRFFDARGADHVFPGPTLHKNDEGSIEIRLTQAGAKTEVRLR